MNSKEGSNVVGYGLLARRPLATDAAVAPGDEYNASDAGSYKVVMDGAGGRAWIELVAGASATFVEVPIALNAVTSVALPALADTAAGAERTYVATGTARGYGVAILTPAAGDTIDAAQTGRRLYEGGSVTLRSSGGTWRVAAAVAGTPVSVQLYVSNAGDDNAPGTYDAPMRTVLAASAAAAPWSYLGSVTAVEVDFADATFGGYYVVPRPRAGTGGRAWSINGIGFVADPAYPTVTLDGGAGESFAPYAPGVATFPAQAEYAVDARGLLAAFSGGPYDYYWLPIVASTDTQLEFDGASVGVAPGVGTQVSVQRPGMTLGTDGVALVIEGGAVDLYAVDLRPNLVTKNGAVVGTYNCLVRPAAVQTNSILYVDTGVAIGVGGNPHYVSDAAKLYLYAAMADSVDLETAARLYCHSASLQGDGVIARDLCYLDLAEAVVYGNTVLRGARMRTAAVLVRDADDGVALSEGATLHASELAGVTARYGVTYNVGEACHVFAVDPTHGTTTGTNIGGASGDVHAGGNGVITWGDVAAGTLAKVFESTVAASSGSSVNEV